MLEFRQKHWENAQSGFERLSNDLGPTDPLLVTVLYYLALTHENRSEFLLAADAFQRVADGFPDDSLGPLAVLGAGRSHQRLWRKTSLDPEEGHKAITMFRMLLASYPTSKEATEALERIDTLENRLAKKDYDTGLHYVRRGAIDPALIYFKDVVGTYPKSATARLAWLRMHELYTKIRWKDDATEVCDTLWAGYPGDAEVKLACGNPPVANPAGKPSTKVDTAVVTPQALARPAP